MGSEVTLSGITTSKLGFGCSSLLRLGRRERTALLDAAFDSGIRHFDVARMYGLGQTESVVGKFAFGRRDKVTIATKFGLSVPRWLTPLAPYQAPARAALERLPRARGAVKQRTGKSAPPRLYSAAQAAASLETSLRELGTDYVDILFVHDPSPADEIRTGELLEFFTSARKAGKIRAWGVSQDAFPSPSAVNELGPSAILQVRVDILNPLIYDRPIFSFGVLGRAHAAVMDAFRNDPTMRSRWSNVLGTDLNHPETLPRLLLQEALAVNERGVVLYSSLKSERVVRAARLVDTKADPAQLRRLRELLGTEMLHSKD